jgi:hypothetical protein
VLNSGLFRFGLIVIRFVRPCCCRGVFGPATNLSDSLGRSLVHLAPLTIALASSRRSGLPHGRLPWAGKREHTRRHMLGVIMAFIVDAACNGRLGFSGRAYFFRRGRYVRYVWGSNQIDQGSTPLSVWNLAGDFLTGVHAALNGDGAHVGKVYFFRRGQYVAYDWTTGQVSGPNPLTFWNLPVGFVSGFGTALNGPAGSGKAYFFHGDQYVQYDWQSNQVDSGSPAPVSDWNLPRFFAGGLHVALNGEGPFQGKAYFFRGPKWIQYDWSSRRAENSGHLSAWNLPANL